MQLINNLVLIFIIIIFINPAICNTAGNPFIKNYGPKEYGASTQNWAIVQDDRGFMYFGNSNGVLEYDGVSWRLIKTNNNAVVRSLAKDKTGKIFVGTFGDFGFLKPDSSGTLQYRSMKKIIPKNYQYFSDIWNIHILNDKVYFKSYKYLFEYFNNAIKVITPLDSEFNESFVCNDALFLEYWQVGLGKLIGDSVRIIVTKIDFKNQYPGISFLLPYGKSNMLFGNPNTGLYIYKNKSVEKFKNSVEDYLIKNQLYQGLLLENNKYAFSTINGGVIIMNKDGSLNQIFDKEAGLLNNTVWQIYEDNQNSLWLATDNGISHVEYPSPITRFKNYSESAGTINQILRFKNDLFLATANGLFVLNENKSKKFEIVYGLNEETWSLVKFKDALLVGTKSGLFIVRNQKATLLRKNNSVYILKSKYFSNRIYIGLIDGLATMHFEKGKWIDDGKIEGVDEYINNKIVETNNGNLWVGHYQGIIHVDFKGKFSTRPVISKYNNANGLPTNTDNYVFSISHKIYFATKNGLYTFDKTNNVFIPDSSLGNQFAGSKNVFSMIQDENECIWMFAGGEVGKLQKNNYEDFEWINIPFLRISDYDINTIYPEKNGIVWFGGADGLYQFNPKFMKTYNASVSVQIRKVTTVNDSLLYGGYIDKDKYLIPEFRYKLNTLRFEFALPSYDHEKSNQFQYFLEGFDKNWSHWSNEPKTIYTNIPEGRYVFRVKAKNIYKIISQEAKYSFIILPPWYRSWWAYSLYGLFIIGVVVGLIKLRSYKLEVEKEQLEKIIHERTDEIQIKNKQLEEQAEKLQEMDEVKSRFFANISHELRTPLTLIKGPTEELVNNTYPGNQQAALNSVLMNTNRMLRLINELLDLSKLESGSMRLKAGKHNINEFFNYIVDSFKSLAESQSIHFQYENNEEDIDLYFDREKFEKIIFNLLSNAFKFTPQSGHITIAANKIVNDSYSEGAIEISIHDSGTGIPEREIDHIFNRFAQAHKAGNTRIEGSGIGLALTKDLVELHHGEIKVTSQQDEGTEFDIVLPLGKKHLQENELVEYDQKENKESYITEKILELKTEIPAKIESEQATAKSEKCLLLVIEDNDDVRKYICDHFVDDFEIIEAEDGKTGINKATEYLPDLIISDVMMPEIDGFELTHLLKRNELTNHIPIILLTAKASDEAKIEGLETGADAYMSKPFNAKELGVRVKKLIEIRNNLREKFKKEFLLEPTEIKTPSLDDDFIRKVHTNIEQNMANPDFNVESLLKDFALGQRQFTRKVIALTGETPVQYLRIMRLKRALQLIKQKAGSISQIAFDVGFSNLSYFSKCFRQQFGKLPSEIV